MLEKGKTMGVQVNLNAVLSITLLILFTSRAKAHVIDVVAKCGAKADGKTEMSQALLNAWKEACESTTPCKILIPKGEYLMGQTMLTGPCKAPMELEVQGTVKALTDPGAFKTPDWVTFLNVDRLLFHGCGVFDGQGAATWGKSCDKSKYCKSLPTNFRFNKVSNALIKDITSKDSKQFQVNLMSSKNLTFSHFTVLAPAESLNTDGIHIARSEDINVINSTIATGDDCVSIGWGAKNVTVKGVTCGPGHGISVGSLGKYPNEEPVDGIRIINCTLTDTDNGVRVKTWPDSHPGTASNLYFENIVVNNVSNPILIDQEYCPYNKCNKKVPSKVKLSTITFKNIRGTSNTKEVVTLICSSGLPCESVILEDIDITYSGPDGPPISHCKNVQPKISGKHNPSPCAATGPLGPISSDLPPATEL